MLPEGSDQGEPGANFPLSGDGLDNFLRTSGSFLFTEIPQGDQLLDFLRNNGVQIGTSEFYGIRQDVLYSIDQVQSLREPLAVLADRNPDQLIPLGYTTEPTWKTQSSEFLYRVALNGFDPVTGEQTRDFMIIGSDVQLTFNEVQDLAGSYIPSGMTSQGNVIEAITLDAAFTLQ